MRIVRAEISAFGYLSNQEIDLDSPIVALLGPNEAGKSTLFHFFRSMLYGFYPASRDQYPYVPWSGATAEGAMDVRLHGGREIRVTRRLMSQPDGRLIEGDAAQPIRNQTAPFIDHIDQRVFDAVYALTLNEMAAIEATAWGEVQDRLLGGMNVEHVHPARFVIAELEEAAKALWKEDRRGKPRARELSDQLRTLAKSRSEAADNDRKLRALTTSIALKEQELRQLKDRQIALEAERRKIQRVIPVQRSLRQIRERELRAGDVSELDGLPTDLGSWLASREQEIEAGERRVAGLEQEHESVQAQIDALTDADRLLLSCESELDDLLTERGPHRDRLNRRQERATEVHTEREKLRHEAERILNGWDDDVAVRVRNLPPAELSQRIQRLQKAEETLREIERRQEAVRLARPKPAPPGPRLAVTIVAAVVAAVLWVAGFVEVAMAAALVAAVSGTFAYQSIRASRRQHDDPTGETRRETAASERDARRRELAELLEDIRVPPGRVADADASLAADLNGLRRLIQQLDGSERGLRALDEAIASDDARARSLAGQAGLVAEGRFVDVAQAVATALEPARERRQLAKEAERRCVVLDRELGEARRALEALRAAFAAVEHRVRLLGEGDIHLGVQTAEDRREAHQSARTLREKLEKDFPDWPAIEAEARDLPELEWSDEAAARLDQELRDVQDQIEALAAEISREQTERRHLAEQTTVAEIDGEIAWLESELTEVQRQRDRLQLLSNVVRQADLRYRERHQPDVLRRAGAYMAAFTGGRYTGLITDDTDGSLLVLPPGQLMPAEIENTPLSQGTRDQIYLALRLAIADHLDEGRVRPPLFLDETFVNWDESRRKKGLEALRAMSQHRQIFVFTCHPWFAEEIGALAGGAVVELWCDRAMVRSYDGGAGR